MKQIQLHSEVPTDGNQFQNLQVARRRRVWPVLAVAGLLLTGTGLVLAQDAQSSLPKPPALPTPVAGAPIAGGPNARNSDGPARAGGERGGRGARMDGPARGPQNGPMGRQGGGPEDGPMGGPGREDGDDPMDGPGRGPEDGPMDGPGRGPRGGPDGDRPTPPDADTQEGAGHALERAYRAIGETGAVNSDAKDIANTARTFYSRAYEAFNAKNYSRAFALADASARLSRTTRALSDASAGGPSAMTVPGLTPPPVVAPKNAADRAAHELNRNYDEANRAARFNNASSNRYRTLSEANYRAALTAYNAKNFELAATKAHLGAEQARAAREYAETLTLS